MAQKYGRVKHIHAQRTSLHKCIMQPHCTLWDCFLYLLWIWMWTSSCYRAVRRQSSMGQTLPC